MMKRWLVLLALLGLAYGVYSQSCTQGPYGVQTFNGALDNASLWKIDFPSNPSLTFVSDGVVGQALRLTQCASSSGTSLCSTSSSTHGQMGAVTINTGAHAGYLCGSGTNPKPDCTTNSDGVGMEEETWYRFHIRFPSPGYVPGNGTQNTEITFHVDSRTETDAANHGSFAYSTLVDVRTDGPTCPGNPPFCTSPGANPNLFLQVPGGRDDLNTQPLRIFPFAPNTLLVNHWYDMILHMVWSPLTTGPTPGSVQWWVDGVKVVDQQTPTLYLRTDGTWSYGNGWGAYNYRDWANVASSVDFDEFIWGPTAATVGFAP